MSEQITLEWLKQSLSFFNKMYDAVRIIDPVKKQVLDYSGSLLNETNEYCYAYWKKVKICDNCISIRAHLENKSFIKLEQRPDFIMMVIAIPIENTEKPIVLELLKNATDSLIIDSSNYNELSHAQTVISNLNDLVVKDHLTSLYNRRFIDDRLPIDIIKSTIEKRPLSVMFMDIDNFKNINDTYGHVVGDLALKEIGVALQNCIRADTDWAARYAGDEFFICLNNTDNNEAYIIAENIRKNIEDLSIQAQNENFHLTISVGIHTMFGMQLTAKEMIDFADKKMFEAKKSGKNRISGNNK